MKKDKYQRQRKWRRNNPEWVRERHRRNRRLLDEFIRLFKELEPCADCGKKFPYYVMDFDHTIGKKLFNIGFEAKSGRWSAVIKEIEKCDLVCANCHRIREHDRRCLHEKR